MNDLNGNIIIYQTEDGSTKINVKIEDETVWLSQQQMAELFSTSRTNIIEHINNIYSEEELDKESTCQNFRQVRKEGNRNVTREIPFYNLDMIISLGYRIKSKIATNFRKWATERLKEYMIKGFTMDDERLKGNGGGNYWKELLARIKDIRSSEKVLYRQVLDLYATAVDYDPKDEESIKFFKIVQNKLHYATHGHTASEVIYERADADKPFMGLTTFKGDIPVLSDVVIAKNYLSEEKHFMDNTIEIDVEMLNRNDWEKAIITKINEIPFDYIGKGEQSSLKIELSLTNKRAENSGILLIEEPENHLTHAKLNKLINDISNFGKEKQIFITTHSSFVANKLGIENLELLNKKLLTKFENLTEDISW